MPHRLNEIARPFKLNPATVAFGIIVTAMMFLMLGFGIARDSRRSAANEAASEPVREYSSVKPVDRTSRGYPGFTPREKHSLVFVDRDGSVRLASNDHRDFHSPRFSPNGRLVLVDFSDEFGRDAWVLALARGTILRATFARDAHDASWSPDGQTIMWTSFRHGALTVYRSRPTSERASDSLITNASLEYTGQLLRDGSSLVTTARNLAPGSRTDVAVVRDNEITAVIADSFDTHSPAVSPDGNWLAYVSNRSGRNEVYVRRFRSNGPDVMISAGGGTEPVWNRDGGELFYRGFDDRRALLIAVTGEGAGSFNVLTRTALFSLAKMVASREPHASYDIAPDGRTFVMVRRER